MTYYGELETAKQRVDSGTLHVFRFVCPNSYTQTVGYSKQEQNAKLESLNHNYVLAVGRILLVLIYFIGGFGLLTGNLPVDYAAAKALPVFAVQIGFVIKLFGGLAVVIGFRTRLAAVLLILFTLGTAFLFHAFWVEGEWNTFWKEISQIGGLLVLAAVEPAALSFDKRAKRGMSS